MTVPKLQAPWHVYSNLQQNNSGAQYQIIDPATEDTERVVLWYQQRPVTGLDVKSVKVIHNPQMGRMFEGFVALLEQRHGNPAFAPMWQKESMTPQETTQRQQTVSLFQSQTAPHSYPKSPHVSLLPTWHGTDSNILQSIFTTGYANLATTDTGFFGKGLYNTAEAEYAYRVYSKGALLVNWVAVHSIFPVIDGDMVTVNFTHLFKTA